MRGYFQILTCILLLLFTCNCSKQTPERVVVASVGNRQITSEEFSLAYELSPRQITQLGKEKAFNLIIDGMIKKSLFAAEARNRGLISNVFIKNSVNYFERAAINRELYLHHVRDSIIIEEDEVRKAYERSNTTLFVKHFITSNKNEAEQISNDKISTPHVALINSNLINIEGIGQVDKISYNEINQNMENIVYSLPLMQLSKPYFDGKLYHIFQIMDKEINSFTTETDFNSKRLSIENTIKKRKEHQAAFNFVNKIMKPENLLIKDEVLNWMTKIIDNEHEGTTNPQYLKTNEVQTLHNMRSEMQTSEFGVYKSGVLTIDEFIETYRMNPIEISYKNKHSIRKSLENIVAIYVRDRVFSNLGFNEKLDKKQSVIDEREFWEERLLANELKKNIFENIQSNNKDSLEIQKKYNQEIENLVKNLRNQSKININRKALMTVKTTDEGMHRKIDFFAKHLN